MSEINVPQSAILESHHYISRDIIEAKKNFWEFAKSRTKYRNQEDHISFEKEIFGEDWEVSSAVYINSPGWSGDENDPEQWITALEISINQDFFGEENKVLIPYAVEHEIFEAWLWSKRGIKPQSATANHLLARRRQFEMAMRDGNAEKLRDFYKKLTPELTSELDYAYAVAKRKVRTV